MRSSCILSVPGRVLRRSSVSVKIEGDSTVSEREKRERTSRTQLQHVNDSCQWAHVKVCIHSQTVYSCSAFPSWVGVNPSTPSCLQGGVLCVCCCASVPVCALVSEAGKTMQPRSPPGALRRGSGVWALMWQGDNEALSPRLARRKVIIWSGQQILGEDGRLLGSVALILQPHCGGQRRPL